ncbi:MAG: hypothetical protein WBH98_05010 [Bacteroidales bacterium]
MNKKDFERFFIFSLIALFVIVAVGIFRYDTLNAAAFENGFHKAKTNYNYETDSVDSTNNYQNDSETEHESIANFYKKKSQSSKSVDNQSNFNSPKWLKNTGFKHPNNLTFEPYLSDFTSVNKANEGFNSVSLVYTGTYENALAYANFISDLYKLSHFNISDAIDENKAKIVFTNYKFADTNEELKYLVSVEITPKGKLTLMITDQKQLNKKIANYSENLS